MLTYDLNVITFSTRTCCGALFIFALADILQKGVWKYELKKTVSLLTEIKNRNLQTYSVNILTKILLIFTFFLTFLLSFCSVLPETCDSYSFKHFSEKQYREELFQKGVLKTSIKFSEKQLCL